MTRASHARTPGASLRAAPSCRLSACAAAPENTRCRPVVFLERQSLEEAAYDAEGKRRARAVSRAPRARSLRARGRASPRPPAASPCRCRQALRPRRAGGGAAAACSSSRSIAATSPSRSSKGATSAGPEEGCGRRTTVTADCGRRDYADREPAQSIRSGRAKISGATTTRSPPPPAMLAGMTSRTALQTAPKYALGRSRNERERLSRQAALLEAMTERLFRRAGLEAGMRVLDVGTGVGDVAFLAAELVGRTARSSGSTSTGTRSTLPAGAPSCSVFATSPSSRGTSARPLSTEPSTQRSAGSSSPTSTTRPRRYERSQSASARAASSLSKSSTWTPTSTPGRSRKRHSGTRPGGR